MTDLQTPPVGDSVGAAAVPDRALWRIRLGLLAESARKNWALFAANPIGIVGLIIIGIFGLMAVLQPWLLNGFSLWRFLVIGIVWATLTFITFATLQKPVGIATFIGLILFAGVMALPFFIGFTLLGLVATMAVFLLLMAGVRRWTSTMSRGMPRRAAGAIALVVAVILGWAAYVTMDAWDARTYHPVVGVELNPPSYTRTVVNDVTDPDTEIEFREALLADPLAQLGQEIEVKLQPAPPDSRHLLGTDPLGRDVLSQLMFGARAAFVLGITTAIVTVIFATTVGAVSAYYGGWIDTFFMRLADLLLMLPAIAIFIVIASVFDFQLWHLALFLGILSGFGGIAIILKSQALAVKVKPFIDAARVAGGTNRRIIFTHIVPNVVPLSFMYMMFSVTAAIQTEATLSFLGLLNIDMSWGIMINIAQSQGYLLQGADFWWLLYPAGLSVTFMAAAFFLVGRGMDEIVNPRLRKR